MKPGQILKQCREQRELSIRAWAKMLRVSPSTINDWETNRRNVNPEKFKRFKKLLTVDECEGFLQAVADKERLKYV